MRLLIVATSTIKLLDRDAMKKLCIIVMVKTFQNKNLRTIKACLTSESKQKNEKVENTMMLDINIKSV